MMNTRYNLIRNFIKEIEGLSNAQLLLQKIYAEVINGEVDIKSKDLVRELYDYFEI